VRDAGQRNLIALYSIIFHGQIFRETIWLFGAVAIRFSSSSACTSALSTYSQLVVQIQIGRLLESMTSSTWYPSYAFPRDESFGQFGARDSQGTKLQISWSAFISSEVVFSTPWESVAFLAPLGSLCIPDHRTHTDLADLEWGEAAAIWCSPQIVAGLA
jgi:hypothetical protein